MRVTRCRRFDSVRGVLAVDGALSAHVIDIEARACALAWRAGKLRRVGRDSENTRAQVTGSPSVRDGDPFRVSTRRYNPAAPGQVTGSATYASFVASVLRACGRPPGVHVC